MPYCIYNHTWDSIYSHFHKNTNHLIPYFQTNIHHDFILSIWIIINVTTSITFINNDIKQIKIVSLEFTLTGFGLD